MAFIATAAGSASAWSLFCKAASASSIITLSAITEDYHSNWATIVFLSANWKILLKDSKHVDNRPGASSANLMITLLVLTLSSCLKLEILGVFSFSLFSQFSAKCWRQVKVLRLTEYLANVDIWSTSADIWPRFSPRLGWGLTEHQNEVGGDVWPQRSVMFGWEDRWCWARTSRQIIRHWTFLPPSFFQSQENSFFLEISKVAKSFFWLLILIVC